MRAKEGTDLWLRQRKLELEQAVIKAARRYIWANEAGVLQGELLDLRDTLEALDKAEEAGEYD